MILLRNLLKGGIAYPKYVSEQIISICTPNVIRCYLKVHTLHPHRKQTIEFIQNVLSNYHYKQNPNMRFVKKLIIQIILFLFYYINYSIFVLFLNKIIIIQMILVNYFTMSY